MAYPYLIAFLILCDDFKNKILLKPALISDEYCQPFAAASPTIIVSNFTNYN